MFVVFEGIEGSGKSTLTAGLAQRLRSEGHAVVVTREPGGTALGDAIRRLFLDGTVEISPLAEALLINSARAQHVEEVIAPALKRRRVVLCDRFVDSTFAYQGYGRGLSLELLRNLCDIATAGLQPDLVFVLDVAWPTASSRMTGRNLNLDRIEGEAAGFHERVRRGFLELAKADNHTLLDGTLPSGEVLEMALRSIRRHLGAQAS